MADATILLIAGEQFTAFTELLQAVSHCYDVGDRDGAPIDIRSFNPRSLEVIWTNALTARISDVSSVGKERLAHRGEYRKSSVFQDLCSNHLQMSIGDRLGELAVTE